MRVLAALGRSPQAPLLAAREGCGSVVLGRVGPQGLEHLRSGYVCVPVDQVVIEGRAYSVAPYLPGSDVLGPLEEHAEGLPLEWAGAIAADLVEGLLALHAAGLGHGDVREENIRLGTDGVSRWVGVRGGASEADWVALSDVFERIVAMPGPLVASLEDRDVAALRALGERRPVADAPALFPHALVGHTLGESSPPTAPPPRLVLARISALVLVLGLGMGWMMAPRGAVDLAVVVPGASGVSLECSVRGCRVDAEFADGDASGRLEAGAAGHYTCLRTAGTLQCTASSP